MAVSVGAQAPQGGGAYTKWYIDRDFPLWYYPTMLTWNKFKDKKPKYNQEIIFIPSTKLGLLFASISRLNHTDAEGDHFSGGGISRAFPEYREEMWASINPSNAEWEEHLSHCEPCHHDTNAGFDLRSRAFGCSEGREIFAKL